MWEAGECLVNSKAQEGRSRKACGGRERGRFGCNWCPYESDRELSEYDLLTAKVPSNEEHPAVIVSTSLCEVNSIEEKSPVRERERERE